MGSRESLDDFRRWNLEEWEKLLRSIFPILPERAIWTDKNAIVSVLEKIGAVDNLAHVFFPDGGGFDLDGAVHSTEPSCIELRFGKVPCVLKPRVLTFESFGEEQLLQAYFIIETDELEPNEAYKDSSSTHEELTEIRPGEYIGDRSAYDSGVYEVDGGPCALPETARCVVRYLSGSFVIFAKSSFYNRIRGFYNAYHARHAKMSAEKFRAHIVSAISASEP